MNEFKKRANMVIAIFCVFLLVTLSLMSLVCYLSFDQNYREIKQSYYAALCGQIISDMETSISYGKRIDRYYGVDTVFERTKALFTDGFEAGILGAGGETLYRTYEPDSTVDQIAGSKEMLSTLEEFGQAEGYKLVNRGGYEVLVMPIEDGGTRAGYFLLSYPMSVYSAQRAVMLREVALYLGIAFAAGLAALLIYFFAVRRRMAEGGEGARKLLLFGVPSGIILLFIVILGVMSYTMFQARYEDAMKEDAASIVEYVRATTQELYDKGVPYEEMYGLDEYLADKVQNVPVLWNLRIAGVLSDSDSVLGRANSAFISIPVEAGGQRLWVEAFISQAYVSGKMWSLFFMFLATFIFCGVIIIEMTKLPAMIDVRRRKDFDQGSQETYEHISSGVRIASFLRTLSNYLYLPYSAMLIKQWNQAVGGLSVGVTAALPLTLESAGQVLGMIAYPIWFKRPDQRSRRFFTICLIGMVGINLFCFVTDSALTIIVLRFFGGLCYSGFMHMLNMIVASGDDGEARHQTNLAQSNAGVIGGIMCGAGIGAIVAALAGYAFSYVISAVMFALFGWFVLRMMPWRLLERNAAAEEKQTAQEGRTRLADYLKILFSPRVLQYFLMVIVPVNFGILYVVTLIPSMVDGHGSTILLSYCYIVNGIAGFYLGPKLVSALGKRMGNSMCVMVALMVAALSLVLLGVPPFVIMVLLSSTLLGVFDGFGTPMATDGFLAIPTIKTRVNEVSALAIYFTLCNVVTVVAPVLIELMTQGNLTVAIWGLAIAYVACALLFAVFSGISRGRGRHDSAAA